MAIRTVINTARRAPQKQPKPVVRTPTHSDSKVQQQLALIPFANPTTNAKINPKTVTNETQTSRDLTLTVPANPKLKTSIPKVMNLMPAMTIPTIGKICAVGIALIGTAVVLSLSIKAGIIVGPLAGVLTLLYVLKNKISTAFNIGKQGASMAMTGASQVMTPQVVAQTATICNNVAAPCLAVVTQGAGLYQELTANENDTEKQQLALQKQRVSAGVWSTSLMNQTMLSSSPKAQMIAWGAMGAMALVTSPIAKTNIPQLEAARETVAAASNTTMEIATAGSLGYQVARSTDSPALGMVVAGGGIVAATLASALVKFENGNAQKLQAMARKSTDLMVKVANSASIGLYVGRINPMLGMFVGAVSCAISLCAFAKTQGVFSGMKSMFSRITQSSKQTQTDKTNKQEEKVAATKKVKTETIQKMRRAAQVRKLAQQIVVLGKRQNEKAAQSSQTTSKVEDL